MPDLTISVENAEAVPFAAAPMIAIKLRLKNSDAAEIVHTVVLRCQIQIEVTRRKYTSWEQRELRDLFGEPERWGQTLRNLLWTNTSMVVPQFTGETTAELQVPCSFDFSLATTKYFHGLADGDIPVCIMFSGSVFYQSADGDLSVAPISWSKEARFRLPVKIWQDLMDAYYPNSVWLCIHRDVFDELQNFKVDRGIPTLEQALETLLTNSKVPS